MCIYQQKLTIISNSMVRFVTSQRLNFDKLVKYVDNSVCINELNTVLKGLNF